MKVHGLRGLPVLPDLRPLKLMGLGLAVTVAVDATIVRIGAGKQ